MAGFVVHYTVTNGSPLMAPPHRLALDKLALAGDKFTTLQAVGIVHSSHSPWASPIHTVLKKDGIS